MNRPDLMRSRQWVPGSTQVAARPPALPAWLALALACALLWAQWAGLVHRVEHGQGLGGGALHAASMHGGQQASSDSASTEADAGPVGLHSCVVFDGLCLADSLPTALLPGLSTRVAHAAPPLATFASWQAAVTRYFQSRAPPAA